ncbi:MAG: phosphodiester glycosidase family protein [Lachnospiraceae bacterium]|nr:phosphodiester glycosidase family protein [Lachnospiraceae bacterium]
MPKARFIWAVTFSIILTGYTTFTLLDTFVIPKESVSVASAETTSVSLANVTENSYEADGVKITLTETRVDDTQVYIADVIISDPSKLKSGLAQSMFGRNITQTTSEIAESTGAILAINGDYYGFRDEGYVMRNGYLYRDTPSKDSEDLVIYEDGTMEVISESDVSAQELQEKGTTQIYSFGPGLISNGEITVDSDDEVGRAKEDNPRTAIGMIDKGHYVFVVSDGRTDESEGLSLRQLAEVMQDLGCSVAYNLDGGGSSTMYFNGEVINNPTSNGNKIKERSVSDIVYIGA